MEIFCGNTSADKIKLKKNPNFNSKIYETKIYWQKQEESWCLETGGVVGGMTAIPCYAASGNEPYKL